MIRPRLELAINSRDGIFIRRVAEATQLPQATTHGFSVENSVINAMSTWGLPDFAFSSSTVALGSGIRELGDGLILTFPFAAVIQVKARREVGSDSEREVRWLLKQIEKATRQVSGTLRKLHSEPMKATNLRGTTIPIVAEEHLWLGVIIIEHSKIPEGFTPNLRTPGEIVLTRADWEFLWEQLQSTVEVLKYLSRILYLPPIPLGTESIRYYELALLDEETEPEPLPPAWIAMGGTRMNGPLLPLEPAGMVVEHYVVRQVMEDLALADIPDDLDPTRLLRAFSALDSINVSQRDKMGKDLLDNLWAISETPEIPKLWSRTIRSPIPNSPQIVLATSNLPQDDFTKYWMAARVELIHDNWLRSEIQTDSDLSVGVLLTPSLNPPRPWDVLMVVLNTRSLLSDEVRREHESLFNA